MAATRVQAGQEGRDGRIFSIEAHKREPKRN